MLTYDSTKNNNPKIFITINILFIVALISLVIGIFAPVLNMTKKISLLWNLINWELENSTFSILSGIITLFEKGEYFIGIILFIFSIAFPIFKCITLIIAWLTIGNKHLRMVKLINFVGKWSMLDVMVIGILVIVAKLSSFADAKPLIGIYFFFLHIICSMIISYLISSDDVSKI